MAQLSQVTSNLRLRRSFGKIKKIIDIPNLIEIQKRSYEEFLQAGVATDQRTDTGLQAVFKSVFPIKDFNETASLEFVTYELGEPKYDVEECHQRGMTYAAPLKVKIQLVIWDVENGRRSIKNVKEQEVYFGEIPLMTGNGTFMVNGTERVIVSQLHRSPGVFFEHDKGRTHSTGKLLYSARIIPYRGSWIDFEFDPRDVLYVRIDRRRKFPATVLLRALGMTTEDLLNYYYRKDVLIIEGQKLAKQFKPDQLLGTKIGRDVKDPKIGRGAGARGPQVQQGDRARAGGGQGQRDSDRARRSRRTHLGPRHGRSADRRSAGADQRGAERGGAGEASRPRDQEARGALYRGSAGRRAASAHARAGQARDARTRR